MTLVVEGGGQVVIEKYFRRTPRRYLAKVQVLLDGQVVHVVQGEGAETFSECEAQCDATAQTAWTMAKAMGVPVDIVIKDVRDAP